MKRYLLDTNICVHFMRQKFGVDEHIEKVGWEHCCISEVTVAELLFGAERSNNVERNLQLVTDFCQDIKVIPLSSALCCYARSKAALYSQETPIEDLDLFIGCTAVANQMIMVTENKKHLLEETKGKLSLDNLFDQIQASDLKELPIIVKADVQGSVEAVKQSLTKLSNEEVVVRVIHGGVGAVNESDVSLAATSNAIIIGFNVRPDAMAKQLADQEGVDLRLYKVIYQAIEDVEAAMKGMLDPVYEEKVIGHAEVRQLFKASGVGTIAGSYVLDGIFQRNCKVRITREGEQVFEGELASLKRFKDDVKEVKAGYECGLVFDGFNDVKEEDKVEAYIMVEVPR